MRKTPTGIRVRHGRGCATTAGKRCTCRPTYEAAVFSTRDNRKIRRTFPTLAAAKAWRADAQTQLRRGSLRAPTPVTVRDAAAAWLAGAKAGTVRTRSGDRFKPSVVRGYEAALTWRLLPEFGAVKLSDVRRVDLQDFADRLLAEGLDASTVRNALMPLRAIFRRAVARGELAVNPTTGLELPAVRGKRDRIVSPAVAAALIGALRDGDRALWGCAFYAGLRRGELRGLDWQHVDLAAGTIRVVRSWDDKAGPVDPKSKAGLREIPIVAELRRLLVEHGLRTGRTGFVFGPSPTSPFTPSAVRRRANTAWKHAGLEPIGLHEARHTFASVLIAAGVNLKAVSNYMGHASVTITLDRYGHLMPGHEAEAVEKIDAYLSSDALASSRATQ
jgi:integrase